MSRIAAVLRDLKAPAPIALWGVRTKRYPQRRGGRVSSGTMKALALAARLGLSRPQSALKPKSVVDATST